MHKFRVVIDTVNQVCDNFLTSFSGCQPTHDRDTEKVCNTLKANSRYCVTYGIYYDTCELL